MAERIDVPPTLQGDEKAQLQQVWSYLYQLSEAINNNLEGIGGNELTDSERKTMQMILSAGDKAPELSEMETLKSLIIKTADYVQTSLQEYRMSLLGETVASGKFGRYVRSTGLDVAVTPEGIMQNYSFQEIIQGLKVYEINAKNYIKTGLLRTVNSLPVYGVAIGKDVVTFSEDGTETYNDGNKVAELTADELSFWQNGVKVAGYTGSRISFYYNGSEAFYILNGKLYAVGDMEITNGKKMILASGAGMEVSSGGGMTIKSGGTMQVQNSGNSNIIKMSNAGLDIESSGSLNVKSGGNMTVKSGGTLQVQNSSNNNIIKMSNAGLDIESGGTVTVKSGGNFKINSGGNIDINGSGTLNLTGSNVSIRSGSTFDVDSTNFKIDSGSKYIKTGDWQIQQLGLAAQLYDSHFSEYFGITMGRYGSQFYVQNGPTISYLGSLSKIDSETTGTFYLQITKPNPQNPNTTIFERLVIYTDPTTSPKYIQLLAEESSGNMRGILGAAQQRWTLWGQTVYYDSLVQSSSRNIKHDIQEMQSIGEILDRLRPVTFVYDDDADERQRMGLIYEDTMEVMPEICTQDETNQAISYIELVPALLKEIQELRKRVAELERRVDDVQGA